MPTLIIPVEIRDIMRTGYISPNSAAIDELERIYITIR
jgi:hypothetical protein